MHLVCWFRYITPHISCVFKSLLALEPDLTITIMAFEDLAAERRSLGWKSADVDGMEVIFLGAQGWLNLGKKYVQDHPDAVHVFLGFWTDRRLPALILYALKCHRKVVVLNEPYSVTPVGYNRDEFFLTAWTKVILRPMFYRLMATLSSMLTGTPSRLCIMPISLVAQDQLLQAGFRATLMYPFGYFVPKEEARTERVTLPSGSEIHLVLVASMLRRKGIDVAIEAIEKIRQAGFSVRLDIYGQGDLHSISSTENEFIRHKGIIPLEQIQSVIARYDALLLPSRHDGWGVVVNEALLQGVPVIVSDRVGAKCLVQAGQAGLVFTSEDSGDLARKIKMLIENPNLLKEFGGNAARVGRQIAPEEAARYFIRVLHYHFLQTGSRPRAIWSEIPQS